MIAVLFACILCFAFAQNDYPCVITINGVTYDLTPLRVAKGKQDWKGNDFFYTYTMNVCGPTNGGGTCSFQSGSICQYFTQDGLFMESLGNYAGVGRLAPTWTMLNPQMPSYGVQVLLPNGNECLQGNIRTVVQFACDYNAPAVPVLQISEDNNGCFYTISLETKYGCPVEEGGDDEGLSNGSWFMIIVFAILLPVYVIGGCVYKRKVKQTTGMCESCPNHMFWMALPSLVADGCRLTGRGLCACYHKHCAKQSDHQQFN